MGCLGGGPRPLNTDGEAKVPGPFSPEAKESLRLAHLYWTKVIDVSPPHSKGEFTKVAESIASNYLRQTIAQAMATTAIPKAEEPQVSQEENVPDIERPPEFDRI